MGVRTTLDPVPSLGLGSIAVSPLDMASAYSTLAGRGMYSRPLAITKVVLPGGIEDEHWSKPFRKRVISDGVAYEVTKILEENIQSGTGTAAALDRPVGRQDRHDRRPCRRLVLRVHAGSGNDRVGRVPAGGDPDEQCPRHLGRGRHVPSGDLAAVHGSRVGGVAAPRLDAAEGMADLAGLGRAVPV